MSNFPRNKYHLHDINNFLKTEAEIVTDFKMRIHSAATEIDTLLIGTAFTHGRIIKKTTDAGSLYYATGASLFIEENY